MWCKNISTNVTAKIKREEHYIFVKDNKSKNKNK